MKFLKQNKAPAVYFEKSKAVSFAPSIMKSICALQAWSRFPVKLIYCIAFGSACSFCSSIKSAAINS